jgi:RHS repeat-associated protein
VHTESDSPGSLGPRRGRFHAAETGAGLRGERARSLFGGPARGHRDGYDVDGNRVKTTVTPPAGAGTAVVTNMLVDTSGGLSQVVAETDAAGVLGALYVRAGDELLEVMRPVPGGTWSTRYVHSDALGSVRTLTDETGTTTDTRGYEAFGTKNVQAGSDPLAYGFAGEPFEGVSKLAYHRARWMDPRVGRFNGMDPAGGTSERPGSLHRYVYAGNNPLGLIDPTGLAYTSAFGQAVETYLWYQYVNDHPGDVVLPQGGQITFRGGGGAPNPFTYLKPDITNLSGTYLYPTESRRHGLWVEVKPLSRDGIKDAIVQAAAYDVVLGIAPVALGTTPILPEIWKPMEDVISVNNVVLLTFNVGGVLFYTDRLELRGQLRQVTTLAAVSALLSTAAFAAAISGEVGGTAGSIARLFTAGSAADTVNLDATIGSAGSLGAMGFVF